MAALEAPPAFADLSSMALFLRQSGEPLLAGALMRAQRYELHPGKLVVTADPVAADMLSKLSSALRHLTGAAWDVRIEAGEAPPKASAGTKQPEYRPSQKQSAPSLPADAKRILSAFPDAKVENIRQS